MYKIAISGKAKTGKNTLASLLKEAAREKDNLAFMKSHNGLNLQVYFWRVIAFADPIKEIVQIMFPQCDKECLYGPSELREKIIPKAFKNGKPLTYRQALTDIGTAAREYNNLVWIENLDDRYQKVVSQTIPPNLVVISDVRFRNEFDYLKSKGFVLIRLYRDTDLPISNHVSETDQDRIRDDEFDHVIFNNQPLEHLRVEVKNNIICKLRH